MTKLEELLEEIRSGLEGNAQSVLTTDTAIEKVKRVLEVMQKELKKSTEELAEKVDLNKLEFDMKINKVAKE